MKKYLVAGDFQVPFHDPPAVETFIQVGEDLEPDVLVINGDFGDYRTITLRYPIRHAPNLAAELEDELNHQRRLLKEIVDRIAPKRFLWNDGNHEWRVWRAVSQSPQMLQLLGVPMVEEAVSISSLLGLRKLKAKYSGQYPKGCWLDPGLPPERNVWVEHGYQVSKRAGYLANRLVDDRMISSVVNHVERLGIIWKRSVGNRSFFGAEAGTLSAIGEPGMGVGIYTTVPHSAPDLMNHRQGFVVIYQDHGHWYPVAVPIHEGRTVFNGKTYPR